MDPRGTSRLPRPAFDGDEAKYELWETKMLGHFHLIGLKKTVLVGPTTEAERENDEMKNADAYAEMIQLLDDKSLSLIMRDAPNDGRKALKILREYYAGKGKPRIINLYTMLTSLQKGTEESIVDYIISAETAITALRNAGETMADGRLIAMVLKGLPESYKPFAVHVAHTDENMTFAEFKTKLRSFEETEKLNAAETSDRVMKTKARASKQTTKANARDRIKDNAELVCFKCGIKGHRAKSCRQKTWCSRCKTDTHKDTTCRRKERPDGARKIAEDGDPDFVFKVRDEQPDTRRQDTYSIRERGLIVDMGATCHIITDETKFKSFQETFKQENHSVELADGTRCSGVALKRGDAECYLNDNG
ncbi:uncharacterized protein LOC130909053 [Corythoichthys intestinalis]|uniref:uncharacterized protein LOC130909053 n=1 Tax=Corythoichthys intestinalis TaxID=161448 RepID=UPI0025A62F30|nr:uncharacterized protein LOC130909053 [Corythoichthys intestinalis]